MLAGSQQGRCHANGIEGSAKRLAREAIQGNEQVEFCEYFDPTTGDRLDGDTLSWTAVAYLVLSSRVLNT